MINIAGTRPIDDPAYRYQMPRLQTKIEGRGNGIKTVVVNMNEVAQALHRDPAEITKFFGCELGAQTTYNVETAKSVVNGAHQVGDMQTHLGRYIEGFVLCSSCRLPETQYKMKTDTIYQKCAACGAKEPVDMTHKLTTFITNSYKKAKKEKGASSDKKSKKDKKKNGESKEESKEKKSKKKSSGEKKSKKKKGSSEGSDNDEAKEEVGEDEDDDDLADDMDELEIDDRSALEAAIERFRAFVGATAGCTITEMADELATLQTFSALRTGDRVIIYIGATFGEDAAQTNAVAAHKQALSVLSGGEPRQLIAAMEWFCGVRFPNLQRWFPALLKHLYDEDLVEEEHFLAWDDEGIENEFSSPSLESDMLVALRAAATPFLTWLREAEEDGDDDDEEDEDEDDEEDA